MMIAAKHSLLASYGKYIYVDQNATGAGTGKSWKDAFTTIQAGLDAASDGGGWTVKIGPGTYSIQSTLHPWPNTTISGAGRDLTIIDGRNAVRGFDCYANRASNCNFEHLTIQNCSTNTQVISGQDYTRCGAAIFGWGNGYWYQQISGSNASTRAGGYVYDCRFYNTNATYGNNYSVAGCIHSFRWVVNCIFDSVKCFNNPIKVSRLVGCVLKNINISHNPCDWDLGSKDSATPDTDDSIAVNCTFFANNAGDAGNMLNNGSNMFNMLFFNWTSGRVGNSSSSVRLYRNSFVQSSIAIENASRPKPTSVASVGTVSNTDPHLISSSPCIGTGTLSLFNLLDDCPVDWTVDLDGNNRIRNGLIDVGAYAYTG